MAKDGLTAKQAAFIREYLVDRNGTAAAERAGYTGSRETLGVTASRLLKDPRVAAALESAEGRLAETTGVTAERVVHELARVAFSDIAKAFDEAGNLLPVGKMPPEARAALAGVETEELFEGKGEERSLAGLSRKVRHWDKVKALELLGKHLGMFKDKVEHSGAEGAPLQIVINTLADKGNG